MLSDQSNEAKCFPVLFPLGSKTFHDSRSIRVTLSRYYNVEYVFFTQYMAEMDRVVSGVSVALRNGGQTSQRISQNM